MKHYLRKYLIKSILFTFCILVLVVIAGSILINNFLSTSKTKIEQELNKHIRQRVSIEGIQYLPPRSIILKNVSILKDESGEENKVISTEAIKLAFSLGEFIRTRDLTITEIRFNKPTTDYFEFASFLKENIEQIIKLILTLPKGQTINLVMKNISLSLPRQDGSIAHITSTASFKIKGLTVISSGSVDMDSVSSVEPLQYNLKGYLTKEGFIIDNIELEKGNFYTKLWGVLEKNILRLNGFSFLSNFFYDYPFQKVPLNTGGGLKLLFPKRYDPMQTMAAFRSNLNIFNINCLIKIVPPTVKIENLSFSINRIPCSLKGSISFVSGISLNMVFSSYPHQPLSVWINNPNKFDIKIAGNLKKEKFNGTVWLDFLRKTKNKRHLEKAETVLKNLYLSFADEGRLKMYIEEADLLYQSGNNEYKIFFKNFNARFNLKDRRFKSVQFNSKIYDGILEGEGQVDIMQTPFRCIFDIKIKDADANKLDSLLVYFSKVYGRLNSQMHYQNRPQSNLDGNMIIHKGYLDNFEFFKWLAEFFDIPSLKKARFRRLSANFLVNDEVSNLDNISLDSEEVDLSGYFSQYENDLVSSRLSLGLSRSLLKTSPKFKSLLKLLSKDFSSLSFDFQLSGISEAMNFKWLESDFKRQLQDRIPDFIERKIERNIEEAIESISEDQ